MKRHLKVTTLLATALLVGSLPAQAADAGLSSRVMSGLGQAIAAQGNIAFREIREELADNLAKSLKPLLQAQPVRDRAAPQLHTAAGNDLPTYVQMHERARSAQ